MSTSKFLHLFTDSKSTDPFEISANSGDANAAIAKGAPAAAVRQRFKQNTGEEL